MSTRAVYVFHRKNKPNRHVYKHHDGYPSGAAEFLSNALIVAQKKHGKMAFSCDELAQAFIDHNQQFGTTQDTTSFRDHGDLEWVYHIEKLDDGTHKVTIRQVLYDHHHGSLYSERKNYVAKGSYILEEETEADYIPTVRTW